ncbi:hypothetical protein OGATHE_003669 [Ogataea polymorpha]|uniref:Uncharacterized protein n=1 Tax=Ogataea polymorpha TaxID=460523 RepID=A0A9P8P4F0_9ASCO|nr:hypothetical protein OGATHE_003669 [Ogataea polymorpha]
MFPPKRAANGLAAAADPEPDPEPEPDVDPPALLVEVLLPASADAPPGAGNADAEGPPMLLCICIMLLIICGLVNMLRNIARMLSWNIGFSIICSIWDSSGSCIPSAPKPRDSIEGIGTFRPAYRAPVSPASGLNAPWPAAMFCGMLLVSEFAPGCPLEAAVDSGPALPLLAAPFTRWIVWPSWILYAATVSASLSTLPE